MLYQKFDLQLFAEDAAAGAAADTSAGENNQAGEPAPAAALKTGKFKYTDADVDEIINKKFAKWQEEQKKAVKEAEKLAAMNATQKAEYERDQLQKELDELKRVSALSEMSKAARKMLSEKGITIGDELLSVMVTDNAETTKAAVDAFSQMFQEAVESAVKERLKGETPRRGTGGSVTMTKEQIMAIRDPELRQKKMLENKELFNF